MSDKNSGSLATQNLTIPIDKYIIREICVDGLIITISDIEEMKKERRMKSSLTSETSLQGHSKVLAKL